MSKVVVFAQVKGGATKSTSCLILSLVLASRGKKVCILDTDPNKTLISWREASKSTVPIEFIGGLSESNIIKTINNLTDYDYVMVDLEGTANLMVSRAIMKASYVIIPLQASMPDAIQANRMVNLIKDEEEAFERPIPHGFLLTRTNPAIRSKIEKSIHNHIHEAGYPIFDAQINERSSFKAIFFHACTLEELKDKDVAGVDKAIKNAEEVCDEMIRRMK